MSGLAKAFADEMRSRREALEMSQEALGAPIGLDRNTVSRMERTAPNMPITKAAAIADVLKTSVAELLGGNEPGKPSAQIVAAIGTQVRQLRLDSELTQQQVAIRMNVDRNRVSAIENGRANVTLLTIEKLAHALNVSPLVLL